MTVAVILSIVIAIVGLAALVAAVKIVRPYQRGLVERLGKYKTTKDPGLTLIVPFVETMQLIDMREQVVDVPPQEVITADNVVVSVDAVVYYEATDPQRLVYNVADFFTAITKLAQTNLRNLIGDLEHPRRFYYIFTRPQWRSWLVRDNSRAFYRNCRAFTRASAPQSL